MDNREEVREFLVSRRARPTPERAGLGAPRGHRRVPGLRRGEVADLAGVSVEYYARLERGNLRGASAEVLDAVARALQLDEAEAEHLLELARAAGHTRRSRTRSTTSQISEHLQHLLDAMTGVPAFVRNGRLDVLAANPLQVAMHEELGILTQAWSPIGGVYGWAGENGAVPPLRSGTIAAIAEAHGKTPAQVILRWHLQERRSAIPKSVKPGRIAENMDVFDFDLTVEDLQAIASLDTGRRGAIDPDDATPEVIDLAIDEA